METILWLIHNGQSALESLGIIGSLIFTAVSLGRETKATRIANLLSITDQYRTIWEQVYDRPQLSRILDPKVDLKSRPMTDEELFFVRTLIIYLGTVYRAIKQDDLLRPDGMDKDVREFFALPIPAAVWSKVKNFQDADFVYYIEHTGIDH